MEVQSEEACNDWSGPAGLRLSLTLRLPRRRLRLRAMLGDPRGAPGGACQRFLAEAM